MIYDPCTPSSWVTRFERYLFWPCDRFIYKTIDRILLSNLNFNLSLKMEESFEPSDCFLMRSSVLLNFWGVLIQSKIHEKAAKKAVLKKWSYCAWNLRFKLFHLYQTNIFQVIWPDLRSQLIEQFGRAESLKVALKLMRPEIPTTRRIIGINNKPQLNLRLRPLRVGSFIIKLWC